VFDLVDKTGERKFTKTKLDTIANTFLSDKGSYYLVKVTPPEPSKHFLMEEIPMKNYR